jgi:hypothetical protein
VARDPKRRRGRCLATFPSNGCDPLESYGRVRAPWRLATDNWPRGATGVDPARGHSAIVVESVSRHAQPWDVHVDAASTVGPRRWNHGCNVTQVQSKIEALRAANCWGFRCDRRGFVHFAVTIQTAVSNNDQCPRNHMSRRDYLLLTIFSNIYLYDSASHLHHGDLWLPSGQVKIPKSQPVANERRQRKCIHPKAQP